MVKFTPELLDMVRVRGTAYFSKNLESPWGVDVAQHPDLCRFHLVLAGSTWIGLQDTEEMEQLHEGDLVIIPHGRAHFIDDRPGRTSRALHRIPDHSGSLVGDFQRLDRRSDKTHVLCGYFQFTQGTPLSIISRLPKFLVRRKGCDNHSEQINRVIAMLGLEMSKEYPASQMVLNRLTEVMFYYAVKGWMNTSTLSGESLHALTDPKLQRVMDEIHQNPAEYWTVDKLANISGQSRTTFANYFKQAIGLTPIAYIVGWRIDLAQRFLSQSDLGLDEIACKIGYNDTSAFSRAFKRATGSSPSAFRRTHRSQELTGNAP